MCVLGLTSLCVILDNLLWAPRNLKLPVRCSWRMFNIGLELLSWRQSKKEFKEKRLLPVPSWRRECKGRWMTLLEKAQPWDVLTSWIGGSTIWRNQEFLSPGSYCYGRNSITNCENFQFTLLKYQRSPCFDNARRNPWVSIPNKLTQLFWCHCISMGHTLNN